jgi:hypothetical protein
VEQETGVGRVLGIDETKHGVSEVLLANLEQGVRDLEDLPGRRVRDALAGLEGVEGGPARQPGRMADLRQHGVRHRLAGGMLDQLNAQRFRFGEALLLAKGEGLLPHGREIGLLHGDAPVRGGGRGFQWTTTARAERPPAVGGSALRSAGPSLRWSR